MSRDKQSNQSSGSFVALIVTIIIVTIVGVAYYFTDGFGAESNDSQKSSLDKSDTAGALADESTEGVPEGFPDNIPIYKPSKFSNASTTRNAKGESLVVAFSTENEKEQVIKFYESALKVNNWEIDETSNENRIAATKGDIVLTVGVVNSGDLTIFTITAPKQAVPSKD